MQRKNSRVEEIKKEDESSDPLYFHPKRILAEAELPEGRPGIDLTQLDRAAYLLRRSKTALFPAKNVKKIPEKINKKSISLTELQPRKPPI